MNKVLTYSLVVSLVFLSACSTRGKNTYRNYDFAPAKTYSDDANAHSSTMDKKTYTHPTMRPYVIRGVKYYPTVVSVGDTFRGKASWYGPDFHGKLTSNGETYNMHDMTAAHKTLPMNTIVKVTNERNGKTAVVRINDRGPFVGTRIIDLSNKAAHQIDMVGAGTAPVKLEVLGFQVKGSRTIPTKQQLKEAPQEQSVEDFALQIASFTRIEGAIITQEKYDNTDGYRTIIKDVEMNDKRIFKVWLKGFKSEQEARDYKENSQFANAFIVKEE
ncbi:MAG: septal ring lytic transglycosylase RlpA family protein [Campylobacterales bacterium]|nr:septal ring lytic transglycosylase RlpA family protein [Campylobacterales bacterium]